MCYNIHMDRDLVKILSFGVDSFNFEEALEYAYANSGQIVTINPEMIETARKNADFAKLINDAELVVPDGIGVEIGLKILGYKVRRIPGIELGKALIIKYAHDGYFSDDEQILSEIVSANPSLVLVALGSPKQEFFINSLKKRLPNATMIGLGGSFDVWAGTVERAPKIYQKLGLEWLYRTLKEPQRFKRIFPTLPLFVLRVCKERLTAK